MKHFFSMLLLLCFFLPAMSQTPSPAPVKTKGCVEGDCINGAGKYLFDNGDKFNGYWKDGIRNDYGRYDYKNGDWYLGDFKNDKIEGKGTYHSHLGKVVSGEWSNYELVKVDKPEDNANLHMKLPIMQNKK